MGAGKRTYRKVKNSLGRRGIYFQATPRSLALGLQNKTVQPELFNRAYFTPFARPDRWSRLYLESQEITSGAETDNVLRQCRFYSTLQFAEHAAALSDGDVVECGCWRGHSAVGISRILADHHFGGEFHVFDSFEGGLSEFKPEDDSLLVHSDAQKQRLTEAFASSFDSVKAITDEFGFVTLHKGWIPDTFVDFEPRPLRFVHVDVDLYEPTKAALEFFWPHMVRGGVLVCDDYNSSLFEGASRAVDEFLADIESPALVYRPPLGSIVLVK